MAGPATIPVDPVVVQSWIDAPTLNFGVVVQPSEAGIHYHIFTREAADATTRPQLTITLQ